MSLTLRPGRPDDAGAIYRFVHELAIHHGHEHEMKASEADIHRALFGSPPYAFCDIAEQDGEMLGVATWFYSWSSWTGRQGIYLEDLFVADAARGTGAGRALMAVLARRCAQEGLPRIEWAVIPENVRGQAFYSKLGAVAQDHAIWRIDGEALATLAASGA